MSKTILRMNQICKSFPGVKALQNVDFDLVEGEVHVLIGENGSGKSTLMKCLASIYSIDEGTVEYMGKPFHSVSAKTTIEAGISMVHQELALNDYLTVADNIFMGCELTKGMIIDRKEMADRAQSIIESVGAGFTANTLVGDLSTAEKQLVEIAKAVNTNAKILILDEPTAVLTEREVEHLFDLIHQFTKSGMSIIYISHRMEEIFQIGDRITVLRDGEYRGTYAKDDLTVAKLISLMVGRDLDEQIPRLTHDIGETILEVKNLTRKDGKVRNASFHLRKGEVLGFAGLVGAGRTELMQMLFGLVQPASGEIILHDTPCKFKNVRDAMQHGIGMVPEERKTMGLVLQNSIKFNLTLGVLNQFFGKIIGLNQKKEAELCDHYKDALSIRMASVDQSVEDLSGGNQQKVVISKWLAISPDILILDEPTRGIDVGAKREVYNLINEMTRQGISIIMISSEMVELLALSDRLYVMYNGEINACLGPDEMNQETVLNHAFGVN